LRQQKIFCQKFLLDAHASSTSAWGHPCSLTLSHWKGNNPLPYRTPHLIPITKRAPSPFSDHYSTGLRLGVTLPLIPTRIEIISTLLRRIRIPPPTAPPGESLCIKTNNQIGRWVFSRFDHVIWGRLKYTIFSI